MSLMRRREMMDTERIIFTGLEISKFAYNAGFFNVPGGVRAEFNNTRDIHARLKGVVLRTGKKYRIEMDASMEKEPAPSFMILNAYPTVDAFWYNGWTYITYKNQGHYSLDVFPEKDRYVEIIGNLNGNSTGYAEFTNFTIYEI